MKTKHLRRVVVTGLGMVSCLGVNVNRNWTRLLRNECGLRKLTDFESIAPCKVAGLVANQELEDRIKQILDHQSLLNGLEDKLDFVAMSRSSRLAIAAALEALCQSGWLQSSITSGRNYGIIDDSVCRAGTHFGTGLEGVDAIIESSDRMRELGYRGMGPHVLTKTLANMPAGHISRACGLRGPCMSTNTACASGLHSIGEAFRMIQHGEADLMVAGSCEAPVNNWVLAAFSRMRALVSGFNEHPELASRPFDEKRKGFVMSEGAGAVVLEAWPTPTSLASNFHRTETYEPIAEIVGFGRSADAHGLVSPEPTGDGAFRCMKAALEDADLSNLDLVGQINCHATSTPLGDAIELAAIARLLALVPRSLNLSPIFLNSIKGHLGHCLGAAGSVETVYSILSTKHGYVVANRNLESPVTDNQICEILSCDPRSSSTVIRSIVDNFSLKTRFSQPSLEISGDDFAVWNSPPDQRRLVLTNSFGFGGTNASILISSWVP